MILIESSFLSLPYKESVPVRGKVINKNRFLKVLFFGEEFYFSTLPGFHNLSLEETDYKIKTFFQDKVLRFDDIDFSKIFFNTINNNLNYSIDGETLFVIESLILGQLKKSHPHLIHETNNLINDLYRSALGPSYYINSKCLKIKIAPTSIDKTIKLLNELHRLNSKLMFRLDGNRLFELNEMIEFEKMLKINISDSLFSLIDYIEEPFKNFSDSYLFLKRSNLKIAMDESFLAFLGMHEKIFPDNIPVVVKPSLTGISPIYNWMKINKNKRIIISSSFEHPTVNVGLSFLASMRPSEFHGLENFL